MDTLPEIARLAEFDAMLTRLAEAVAAVEVQQAACNGLCDRLAEAVVEVQVQQAACDELLTRLAEAITAVEARQADHEQRDRNRIVIRWPRDLPINGELLTLIRDRSFDSIVVEI